MALPAEITAVARHAGRALPGAGALGARHAHLAGDQSGQPPELAGADRHGDDRSQDLLQSEPLAEARRLLPTERLAGRAQPAPAVLRLSRRSVLAPPWPANGAGRGDPPGADDLHRLRRARVLVLVRHPLVRRGTAGWRAHPTVPRVGGVRLPAALRHSPSQPASLDSRPADGGREAG